MIARDYLLQTNTKGTQRTNAQTVIDNAGDTQKSAVKNAWDSLRKSRNKRHSDGNWEGQWYTDQEFEAASKANLTSPSQLPKQAAPAPSESKTPSIIGSGLHAPRFVADASASSFLGNRKLRRGFNLDLEMPASSVQDLADEMGASHEWKPASW